MVNSTLFEKWIEENISTLNMELAKCRLKANKYQKIYSGKLFAYTRLNGIDCDDEYSVILEDIEEKVRENFAKAFEQSLGEDLPSKEDEEE